MTTPIAEETRPVEITSASEHLLDPGTLGDHFDRLFRAAWALCGSREDAEDLVQDTYAGVLARPRLVRNDDDLGYLLSAVRNTFFNSRRRAARRPQATRSELESLELADLRSATLPPAAAERREVFATIAALPSQEPRRVGKDRDVAVSLPRRCTDRHSRSATPTRR
jgi:RNA polymerase sigma-70 factor (ECF subfamily)